MRSRTFAPLCALGYFWRTCFSRSISLFGCLLALVCFAPITLSSCATQPIHIQKAPPEIKTQYFDKGMRPPESSPPEHNDCANTHWHYGFIPKVAFDLVQRERVADGEIVLIKIKKVDLKLNLQITMWLPEKASEDVIAHEKGHAAICLDAYKSAETYARAAAEPFVGKQIRAHGSNFEATINRALTDVNQEMARKYREETVERANITGALYDKITLTDHAASKVEQKITDAEIEYQRLLPELQTRRAEEERQLKRRHEQFQKKQEERASRKSAPATTTDSTDSTDSPDSTESTGSTSR